MNLNPSELYWNAVANGTDIATLDELNAARIEHETCEMNHQRTLMNDKVAVVEWCGVPVIEAEDALAFCETKMARQLVW